MLRIATTAMLAATLGACASVSPPLNADNFLMRVPQGSRLVLKQEIVIPERWARVAIQDGKVLADRRDIDRSRGYCELQTDRVSRADDLNVVKPDTFETGVESRPWLNAQSGPWIVAATMIIPEHGKSDRIFRTKIPLASAAQPSVKRLVCEYTENPVFYQHLTINQIRAILGELFELQLAGT
ncbi:MAG: hypothetical protein OET44_09290 [Gammaproteobacteria bacterium]|nr:hypothetical protein [Gammaproteobacteria bacterium]